jgi:hypothetical protein
MSDSRRLHASCLSFLQSKLGDVDFRNLDTWAWADYGRVTPKNDQLAGLEHGHARSR